MQTLSRDEGFQALQAGVDVLVIGGGITGAGVALDAASRGYRVGLVDRADFASGTSSRSTKLVHGGIRYLPQGHIGLVREGLRERTRLLRLAPHVVHPLPFIIPLYAGTKRPLGVRIPAPLRPLAPLGIRTGLSVYDWFAGRPDLRHRRLARSELEAQCPDLYTEGLRAALVYYDARTDDVRLTHAVLATARMHGAVTVNHAEVRTLLRAGGAVAGARVEDRLTGRSYDAPARFVVNATGIWGERVAALDGMPPFRIRHSKGTHLVLRAGAIRASGALVIPETDDGRLAFIVPWAGRPLVGTTDEPYEGDLADPRATPGDVRYLLDHANRYLRRRLDPGDVTAAWSGIRPLVAAAAGGATAGLARDHVVSVSAGGLVSIVGGKLTSYRKMAEDAVDVVVRREGTRRPCRTADMRLAGAEALHETQAALAVSRLGAEQQTHLFEAYGSRAREILALIRADPALASPLHPTAPAIGAEVVYACRAEMAVSLSDVMFLRTRLGRIDAAAAAEAAPAVAALMAQELRWEPAEVRRQREQFEAALERERAWMTPAATTAGGP
ncbi:MAG: glycerol-3-phosphate dehydrogenase/oxidase [Armatimonadota bacterium]|nr:glycerol-3-phosphate dehydrogenase/oxidase [Armatimonadota bacterium]